MNIESNREGEQLADPAQRDLAWAGYDPRAMFPAIALSAIVSLLLWTGRWYLDDFSVFADRVGSLAMFALAWGVWPALAAVFLYRTVTYTYRLTDRSLLVDFGFLSPPVAAVDLGSVTGVAVGGGWIGRHFGVGWVEVRSGERSVRLRGVRQPALMAVTIREATQKAKAGT
jgi:hypothetical protein